MKTNIWECLYPQDEKFTAELDEYRDKRIFLAKCLNFCYESMRLPIYHNKKTS